MRIVVIIALLAVAAGLHAQIDITKRTVTTDSLRSRGDTLWITNKTGGLAWIRVSNEDSLFFKDASGEMSLGVLRQSSTVYANSGLRKDGDTVKIDNGGNPSFESIAIISKSGNDSSLVKISSTGGASLETSGGGYIALEIDNQSHFRQDLLELENMLGDVKVQFNMNLIDILDVGGNCVADTFKGVFLGDYPLRHAFLYKSATYTPAVTQNVYTKITPTFTIPETSYITAAGDSLTIQTSGDYYFLWTFQVTGTNTSDFDFQVRKNNVSVQSAAQTTTGAGNYHSISVMWYFQDLVAGDDISFYVTNTTNGDDPTIRNQSLYLRKEHD